MASRIGRDGKRPSEIGRRRVVAKESSSKIYLKRREEIVRAAMEVFNRLGFANTTLRAVAQELNIDRATLYYYVGSKEDLFDDLVRDVVERNAETSRRILSSSASPRLKLRELTVALMASYGDHYPLLYIFIRENLGKMSPKRAVWAQRMRALNREVEDVMTAIIEDGYAKSAFRNIGPPRVVASGIFGAIGWTHRWFRPSSSNISAREIGATYAELVLTGLDAYY